MWQGVPGKHGGLGAGHAWGPVGTRAGAWAWGQETSSEDLAGSEEPEAAAGSACVCESVSPCVCESVCL